MSEKKDRWQAIRRPLARVLIGGMLAVSLQGCIEMAIGTALVGTMAAVDRRTLGAQTEDKTITIKANARLRDVGQEGGNVNVVSFNRKVLLTGEVKDEAMRQHVERTIAAIEGVEAVHNELAIDFASGYGARSYDTLLTTKVKASLIDAKDLHASAIKVVSERNVVYLLGLVTEREGTRAAEIASGVSGVTKVVKMFETITEQQLAKMTSAPAGNGSTTAPPADAYHQSM